MSIPVARLPEHLPTPVLRETRYDLTSSLLMAITGGLTLSFFFFGFAWYASRPARPPQAIPVEIVEMSGGDPEGEVGETLRVDSPAPESADASLAEVPSEVNEVQEVLETVSDLANQPAEIAPPQPDAGVRHAGKPGSARGTGRKPLGQGPGAGGIPREQRWFIRYGDQQTLEEYGRQLDFFGVELGTISDGKLLYLSHCSEAQPQTRAVNNGGAEQRLYMTWQGGGRRTADLQLFRKAGIDPQSQPIFHFYPPAVEQQLARLELDYRNRKVDEIRRTYFSVGGVEGGYAFHVTKQTSYR